MEKKSMVLFWYNIISFLKREKENWKQMDITIKIFYNLIHIPKQKKKKKNSLGKEIKWAWTISPINMMNNYKSKVSEQFETINMNNGCTIRNGTMQDEE